MVSPLKQTTKENSGWFQIRTRYFPCILVFSSALNLSSVQGQLGKSSWFARDGYFWLETLDPKSVLFSMIGIPNCLCICIVLNTDFKYPLWQTNSSGNLLSLLHSFLRCLKKEKDEPEAHPYCFVNHSPVQPSSGRVGK